MNYSYNYSKIKLFKFIIAPKLEFVNPQNQFFAKNSDRLFTVAAFYGLII